MNKTVSKFALTAGLVLAMAFIFSCSGDDGGGEVWLWSKRKYYTVTDGVASGVYLEYNNTYTSYIDDKHYEQQYSYTYPYNTYTESSTYTTSTVGSQQYSYSDSRNGNTQQTVTHSITDYTTTRDYIDPAKEDEIKRTTEDITTTSTTVYHEENELALSYSYTQTGTRNGEPVNGRIEAHYTIVPLSTGGDVKTYRVTIAGGNGAYSEYKVQNGVTLEANGYTAEGAVFSTTTYTFPDNATIRAKLPTLTIPSGYTCEVVHDSSTELVIRVKAYSAEGVLLSQYETTYVRRSL